MDEVTIYTKPDCPYCKRAKDEMDLQGIAYKEIDASASAEAKGELVRISGQSMVPTIIRNGQVEVSYGGG